MRASENSSQCWLPDRKCLKHQIIVQHHFYLRTEENFVCNSTDSKREMQAVRPDQLPLVQRSTSESKKYEIVR